MSSEGFDEPATPLDDTKISDHEGAPDATRPTTKFEEAVSVKKNQALKTLKHLLRLGTSPVVKPAEIRNHLWRAYTKSKSVDQTYLFYLADCDWEFLWTTQSVRSSRKLDSPWRLIELYRDLQNLGKVDTIARRADYLESLFEIGKEEEALKAWNADHFQPDHRDSPEHLLVGAKLHALAGYAIRARNPMNRLFKLYPDYDTSIMMNVIRAHTSSADLTHHDFAKYLYAKMKEKKGAGWTMADYDACLVGFMEARHLQYAKEVFRDMVKDGHLAGPESPEGVKGVLERLHMLYQLGTDIYKMTSIALDALEVLPPAYHEHLFGDWMKTAVVQKAPDAASQILDMMIQRGYQPQAFHFNMLLRALLRTTEEPNTLKAENIAWRMINEAREASSTHVEPASITGQISQKAHLERPRLPAASPQNLPQANIATFALMMQHHAKKTQWEHVDYLMRQLKEADMAPNDSILNILIDNKCRQGAHVEAYEIYRRLTHPPKSSNEVGVFPNGASIRIVWKNLRLALGSYRTREDPKLPTCRDLLKETVKWWKLCRSRYDAERFRIGLTAEDHGAIMPLVLHCFSYTSDLAGSLAALHVLRKRFDIYPHAKATRILQRQMAWVDMSHGGAVQHYKHFHSRSNARKLASIERVYNVLAQQRMLRMGIDPMKWDPEKYTPEEIGDMELDLLSEFVRVFLKRTKPPEVVEEMMAAATLSVGCPGMETGDLDAWEVA